MAKNLFINGKFYTDENKSITAIYCVDGIMEQLLDDFQLEPYMEQADEVIDLDGKFGYPDFCGFIEEVEFDCSEGGEDMLNLYDRKMAKKILNDDYGKRLSKGEVANIALYDMDLIKNTDSQRTPPTRMLIVNGEVFYDEEAFMEEQFYNMMISQQF